MQFLFEQEYTSEENKQTNKQKTTNSPSSLNLIPEKQDLHKSFQW